MDLQEVCWGHGLDWSDSGLGEVASFCECGNEPSCAVKCGALIDHHRACRFLKDLLPYSVKLLASYLPSLRYWRHCEKRLTRSLRLCLSVCLYLPFSGLLGCYDMWFRGRWERFEGTLRSIFSVDGVSSFFATVVPIRQTKTAVFLISNFLRVLNIVCVLLGISPASDCDLPHNLTPGKYPKEHIQ
jgi:hypothetical protein